MAPLSRNTHTVTTDRQHTRRLLEVVHSSEVLADVVSTVDVDAVEALVVAHPVVTRACTPARQVRYTA